MKSNKLDISWFDLKNYDALYSMQIGGWIHVIQQRIFASNPHIELYTNGFVEQVKSGHPIIDSSKYQAYLQEEVSKSVAFQKQYSTASVNSMSTYDLWHLTRELHHPNPNEEHISQLSYLCQLKSKIGRTHDKMNLVLNPYEVNLHEAYYPDQPINEAHVKVNLMATDDQLKQDFEAWLKNYRSQVGSTVIETKNQKAKKVKKVFDSVDFKKWIDYRVIPFIDLKIVESYEGSKISKAELAKLFFSDQDTDNGNKKLNKTIDMSEFILINRAHETLKAQLLMEKISERRAEKISYQ